MMLRTRYTDLIKKIAGQHQLDPLLVEAIVIQESSGNTDAFRFEPNFYNRYLKLSPDWEWARKKYANPRRISSSYGLMQVMWAVALEEGYSKDAAPEGLFLPEIGLEYGCRRLGRLQAWSSQVGSQSTPSSTAERILEASVASYNGGRGGNSPLLPALRNGAYARSVLRICDLLRGETNV